MILTHPLQHSRSQTQANAANTLLRFTEARLIVRLLGEIGLGNCILCGKPLHWSNVEGVPIDPSPKEIHYEANYEFRHQNCVGDNPHTN